MIETVAKNKFIEALNKMVNDKHEKKGVRLQKISYVGNYKAEVITIIIERGDKLTDKGKRKYHNKGVKEEGVGDKMTLADKIRPSLATRFEKSTDDMAREIEKIALDWLKKEIVPSKKPTCEAYTGDRKHLLMDECVQLEIDRNISYNKAIDAVINKLKGG